LGIFLEILQCFQCFKIGKSKNGEENKTLLLHFYKQNIPKIFHNFLHKMFLENKKLKNSNTFGIINN
jgi:hypothetical protein